MIEWLLSNEFLPFTVCIIIGTPGILFGIIAQMVKKERLQNFFFAMGIVVPIILLFISLVFLFNIKKEYNSDTEWKQIYVNDINADITLELDESRIPINKPLKYEYKLISESQNGKLALSKENTTIIKTIYFDSKDIQLSGNVDTLTKDSKITKVEYRPVSNMRRTAFGYYGDNIQPDVDGQIRITVETTDHTKELTKELNNLLEN
jgi:hypothetical protein